MRTNIISILFLVLYSICYSAQAASPIIGGPDGPTFIAPMIAKETTTPSNPAAGYQKLYFKSVDGKLYRKNSAGVETEVGVVGANTTLSNLGVTAINQHLLTTASSFNIGSSSTPWSQMFAVSYSGPAYNLRPSSTGSNNTQVTGTSITTPSGATTLGTLYSFTASNNLGVITINNATANATPTSSIYIETGNKSHASATAGSGDIKLYTGTVTGANVRGKIKFVNGSEGTTGHVWTSTGTDGSGGWAEASGGGANTTLSNLGATAINADLLPDGSRNIGSETESFKQIWTESIRLRQFGGSTYGFIDGTPTTLPGGATAYLNLTQYSTTSAHHVALYSQTNSSAGTPTANVYLETGNNAAGTSGDISLRTGTGSTRGVIKLIDGSEGTIGHVWTSTGTGGQGEWAAATGGANIELSNLGVTAVNADLFPESPGAVNIGDSTNYWDNVYANDFNARQSVVPVTDAGAAIGTTSLRFTAGVFSSNVGITTGGQAVNNLYGSITSPSGTSGVGLRMRGDGMVDTRSDTTADANPTGSLFLETGNKSAGSGNSGDIKLFTGLVTGSSGTRGKIKFVDGSEGTTGHIWTSTGTAGEGAWAEAPEGFANPMTTDGDLITRAAGVPARIAIGGANTALLSDGSAAAWGKIANANVDDAAAIAYSKLNLTGAILGADLAGSIDATKIADGSVTDTEFTYINTLSSNAQSQIDGKQAAGDYITALTGDVTAAGPGSSVATITNLALSKLAPVTANRVIVSDGSGVIDASSSITTTEVGLLDGLTGTILTDTNTVSVSNKTLDADSNTFVDLVVANFKTVLASAGKYLRFNQSGVLEAVSLPSSGISINMLKEYNPQADDGISFWSESGGGTLDFVTTGIPDVTGAAFSFDASADTDYAESTAVDVPEGLIGGNCLVQYFYKGFDGNITFQVHDGTSVVVTETLSAAATKYTLYQENFPCPSSGTLRVRILASGNAAIGYWSKVHLGSADNIYPVSQASFYGSAKWIGTTNCNWAQTAGTSYGNFSADADCTTPTGTNLTGNASAPATKIPAITFNSLPPGEYLVTVVGHLYRNSASGSACYYRLSDGTSATSPTSLFVNGITNHGPGFTGRFTYTTPQSNVTFQLQAAAATAISCEVYNANPTNAQTGFEISVYHFPLAPQQALNLNSMSGSWSGYHNNTCSWARTNTAYGDPATDATCTLVERNNQNFGTVTSSGNLPNIVFTPSYAGRYYVCAHVKGTVAVDTASAAIKLWDGTTIIAENGSWGSATNAGVLIPVCGIYNATSTSAKTISVQTRSSTGAFTVGANTSDTAIEWSIFSLDRAFPASVLVGSVTTTDTSSPQRIERANVAPDCTSSPCTIVTKTAGINAVTRGSTGTYTMTFVAGTFSGEPTCTISPDWAGGYPAAAVRDMSATQITIDTYSHSGVAEDNGFNIICMGPR